MAFRLQLVLVCAFLAVFPMHLNPTLAQAEGPLVFISAFAGEQGAIHAFHLDMATGKLTEVAKTTDAPNPFYLAISPDEKYLYSICAKEFGGKQREEVAAYALQGKTGKLLLLNRQSAMGSSACYLHVDATGRTALVANYSTGSVASLPILPDGKLDPAATFVQHTGKSVNPDRQEGPHAHSIITSPDNRYVYAADLGLDQVLCYRLDADKSTITPNDPPYAKTPEGAGPRHITFNPRGTHLYAINELANSVSVFKYDAESGRLTEQQVISTLPADFTGTSYCADVKITPDGKYLFGTNRGHDSVAAYRIADDGSLTLVEIEPSLGKGPQNLAIAPGGKYLLCANMPGSSVAVFKINADTGEIEPVGEPVSMPSPSCIMILE